MGIIESGFFLGAIILLAAIVWGVMAYNRRNRANEPVTEAAVRAEYADTDSYGEGAGAAREAEALNDRSSIFRPRRMGQGSARACNRRGVALGPRLYG